MLCLFGFFGPINCYLRGLSLIHPAITTSVHTLQFPFSFLCHPPSINIQESTFVTRQKFHYKVSCLKLHRYLPGSVANSHEIQLKSRTIVILCHGFRYQSVSSNEPGSLASLLTCVFINCWFCVFSVCCIICFSVFSRHTLIHLLLLLLFFFLQHKEK